MSSDEKQRDVSGVVTSTSTNEKGASEASKKQTPLKLDVWTVVLIVAGVFLLVTAVGGYIFNWNWTGFQGNTLWDWFKLLLLPVVLGTAKLTYRGHQREWAAILGVFGVFLLVTVVGGYLLNWRWTGFRGNTLWDWLTLLLIPVAFVAVKLTYREYQGLVKKKREKEQQSQASLHV